MMANKTQVYVNVYLPNARLGHVHVYGNGDLRGGARDGEREEAGKKGGEGSRNGRRMAVGVDGGGI